MTDSSVVLFLLCTGVAVLALIVLLVVVGQSQLASRKDEESRQRLEIERERNEILRESLALKKAQLYIRYRERADMTAELPEAETNKPMLHRGQTHTYQRKTPRRADEPTDEESYTAHQEQQDKRIERIKRYRKLD